MPLTVEVFNDGEAECPSSWGGWKLISFNSNHRSFEDPYRYLGPPDESGEPTAANIGIKRKLGAGTAHILSYYEHGFCVWGLKGEAPPCPWDSVRVAGLLIWQGKASALPRGYEPREESARSFLRVYTDWANGSCYGYAIEDNGEVVDSCCGFYGEADLRSAIQDVLKGTEANFKGEASWVLA